MKHPVRGGQNLTQRYQTLERMLRGKRALLEDMTQQAQDQTVVSSSSTTTGPKPPPTITFHGLVIPKEPRAPDSDECCMSGCAICVYDLYNDALDTYTESLARVRGSLAAMRVPEAEWPPQLRAGAKSEAGSGSGGSAGARSLSAFEELERALQEKREKERVGTNGGGGGGGVER
ncbi:hypothetical protein BD779DRAFT_1446767 [Infundibulicybe gibba]|nr:hypothetical protein BD779DRAFT_1446767 [Infundibulicybe gibba]